MAIPEAPLYGTITGNFRFMLADGIDPDSYPDLPGASGTVTFTPSAAVLRYSGTSPTTLLASKVECRVVSGVLVGPDGNPGVRLLATDHPDVTPSDFTYLVEHDLVNAASQPTKFSFSLPGGMTVDLSRLVPVTAPEAVPITSEAVRIAAEQARIAAERAAKKAEDIAENLEDLGGGSDEDTALYISTPNSKTAQAISDAVPGIIFGSETLRKGYSTSTEAATTRFVRLLERPIRDVHLLMPGDSTHLQTKPWPKTLLELIGTAYPEFTVKYYKWLDAEGKYADPETLRVGTGSFTIHLWNLAYSGRTWSYYMSGKPWTVGVLGIPTADLIIASQGFNEVSTPELFAARYISGIETLRTVFPQAEVISVVENAGAAPLGSAAIAAQATRADVVRNISAQRGFGLIDVHNLFVQNKNFGTTWLQADGIHPNDLGMDQIAALAYSHFVLPSKAVPKSIQTPAFSVSSDNLLPSGTLDGWDGTGLPPGASSIVGTGTATRDTQIFESKGYSVKLSSSAGGVYLPFDVPLASLPRLKSGWVTASARVYVPSGSTLGVGRVGLDLSGDGTNLVQSNGVLGEGVDGWRWISIRVFVTAAATRIRFRIYCATGGDTGGGTVYIDRLSVVQGTTPREAGSPKVVNQQIVTPTTGLGFPATVDPGLLRGSDQSVLIANRGVFQRVLDGGTVSKLALHIGAVSGNISVGIYKNTGTGRSAIPGTPLVTTAAVACPAVGYAEIDLGGSFTVEPGDWIALSADNNTAAFKSLLNGLTTTELGRGRTYIRDNAFPLPSAQMSGPSLQPSLGPSICIVGV